MQIKPVVASVPPEYVSFTADHQGDVGRYRREDKFRRSVKAVTLLPDGTLHELLDVRWYDTQFITTCAVWVSHVVQFNHAGDADPSANPYTTTHLTAGSGRAVGYGYHRPSTAFQSALLDAGVLLMWDIDGRGDDAVDDAVAAVAQHLCFKAIPSTIPRPPVWLLTARG